MNLSHGWRQVPISLELAIPGEQERIMEHERHAGGDGDCGNSDGCSRRSCRYCPCGSFQLQTCVVHRAFLQLPSLPVFRQPLALVEHLQLATSWVVDLLTVCHGYCCDHERTLISTHLHFGVDGNPSVSDFSTHDAGSDHGDGHLSCGAGD